MNEFSASATVRLWPMVKERSASALAVHLCLGELIDNAIDAGATSVSIDVVQGKSLRIRDNGCGIPEIKSLVIFNEHVHHKTTRSGMYGIGFKDAALSLGREDSKVNITTFRDGIETRAEIQWRRLERGDECMTGTSIERTRLPGTDIMIAPLVMRFPDGEQREKLLRKLGYMYSAAIRGGVAIRVTAGGKSAEVSAWDLPPLAEEIATEIDIGGKRAKLRAGIVAKGHRNDYPGITYAHGFRVIKQASAAGCGGHDVSRICGIVELAERDSWTRSKNKDDLIGADDLFDEVERILSPLLSKASEHAHSIEFETGRKTLEGDLTAALCGPRELKARRGKGSKTGTVEPTGTGRGHATAARVQRGATFGRRAGVSEVQLHFRDGWNEEEPLGTWEAHTRAARITLYRDHPMVAAAMKPWDARQVFSFAMMVAAVHSQADTGAQLGWATGASVLVKLANLTAKKAKIDGRNLAEAAE